MPTPQWYAFQEKEATRFSTSRQRHPGPALTDLNAVPPLTGQVGSTLKTAFLDEHSIQVVNHVEGAQRGT